MRFSMLLALVLTGLFVVGCSSPGDSSSTPNSAPGGEKKSGEPDAKQPDQPKDGGGTTAAVDFAKDVQPVLAQYCGKCHGGAQPAGGLDITAMKTGEDAKAAAAKMARMVEGGKMPPQRGTPLPEDVKTKLVANLKSLGG